MDKSGRVALSENLQRITEGTGSRRGWAADRRIDVKTIERAEKDEGEKGVTLQAVDDIAAGLGLSPWQLLVPGLDIKNPPRLSTDPQPTPMSLGQMALAMAAACQELHHDCAQLSAEVQRIQARANQIGGRLDQAAANDKAITSLGVVLFWPALFALGGTKQQEADYARLKGELDAVQQAAIAKRGPALVTPPPEPPASAASAA